MTTNPQSPPSPSAGAFGLNLSQSTFNRFQFGTVTVLIALTAFHYVYADAHGKDMIAYLSGTFDAGRENSIPTWFSILNLLLSGLLVLTIFGHARRLGDPAARYWLVLGILMLGLSMDEGASLHERLQRSQEVTGVLVPMIESHPWLLYGAVFATLAFLVFVPFLRRIGPRLAALFLLSGGLFLAGALGFEFMAAWMIHNRISAPGELLYLIRRAFEEGCEMYGIALFNCVLFGEIRARNIALTLTSRA